MRVAVQGLWHLGTVTAACLAAAGHDVVGLDEDAGVVARLSDGSSPISEPGLDELVRAGIDAGRLGFDTDPARALSGAEVLWVTFDTPVDDNDVADTGFVSRRVEAVLPHLAQGALVIVSSQLPVGSVAALERHAQSIGRDDLSFASSPENLRLGKAIEVFSNPDRVIVGVRDEASAETARRLLQPITDQVMIVGVESAEMIKHAINSFLAMSVAFANEIGSVCEVVGADAAEVARGLKSEARIGQKAYVGPGAAFAGGTLARDIAYLTEAGEAHAVELTLIPSVATSNTRHRGWALRTLQRMLGDIRGRRIAILGLTYKPGTNTLRRSSSVELARALVAAGAVVAAYDPAIPVAPADLDVLLEIAGSAAEAVTGADAVVVATEWPQFKDEDWPAFAAAMAGNVILDAAGMVAAQVAALDGVTYASVGRIARQA